MSGTIVSDMDLLNFEREKEAETESWQRAREDDAQLLEGHRRTGA